MGKTVEERFWSKVDIRGDDECWEWTASSNKDGYGQLWIEGKPLLSHRISWGICNDCQIPKGLIVMHSCDNPPCINPNHLLLGTRKDNVHDMVSKGRSLKGRVRPSLSRLTEKEVLKIRELWATREYRMKDLASMFNVSPGTISNIINGRTWKNV